MTGKGPLRRMAVAVTAAVAVEVVMRVGAGEGMPAGMVWNGPGQFWSGIII